MMIGLDSKASCPPDDVRVIGRRKELMPISIKPPGALLADADREPGGDAFVQPGPWHLPPPPSGQATAGCLLPVAAPIERYASKLAATPHLGRHQCQCALPLALAANSRQSLLPTQFVSPFAIASPVNAGLGVSSAPR